MNMNSIIGAVVCAVICAAALNVTVAWILAAWAPHSGLSHRFVFLDDPTGACQFVVVNEYVGIGMVRRDWYNYELDWGHFESRLAVEMKAQSRLDNGGSQSLLRRQETWGSLQDRLTTAALVTPGQMEDARGWPFLSFWCAFPRGAIPSQTIDVLGGFELTEGITSPRAVRALPYIPIWRGFILNTVIYATVIVAVYMTGYWIRRRIRHMSGRCIYCAYESTGLIIVEVCPECGRHGHRQLRSKVVSS